MTLELNKVTQQIDDMSRILVERAARQRKVLPAARELLRLYAHDQERLRDVAESEPGRRLRCASPGEEPLDATVPVPEALDRVTLVASDGSQIFPDRHGLAFYYAINIGTIVFRHGSGEAPDTATDPQLYYSDDQVYPAGYPITSELVSAERNLAEMRALSNLASKEPEKGPPCLALADGPLLLWFQRANIPQDRQEQILADYLSYLSELRNNSIVTSGFVSRPHSSEVVALLYLAHLEPEERTAIHGLAETSFRGLTDRALFGFLEPGERSALFVRGAAANQDYQVKGQAIYFYYLNTGTDIARIEVPEWVVRKPDRLKELHATLHDQCRFNKGYPYVLTRADELAVIHDEEREALLTMIGQAMARHGLPLPEPSRKAQQKQVARWRRRR